MRYSRGNRRKIVKRRPQLPKLPQLPRIRIDWQALLLVPAIAVLGFGGVVFARTLLDRPIGALSIEGTFQRVTPIEIEAALAPELKQGFLSADLETMRERVRALDWVDKVRIGRLWPDRLVVSVTEHRVAARWGDNGLLNVRGELFTMNARHMFPELPSLAGPDGSEHEVSSIYLAVRGRLAAAHLTLESLRMDARGALTVVLGSGQEIRLGRKDTGDRLERFFDVVAPALGGDFGRIGYVDLRYTNGFAVGWLEPEQPGLANNKEENANRG
jgi:cell division protein FtsQ